MARLSSENRPASIPDPTPINLIRILARLQQTLDSLDPEIDSKLRGSSLEREKVGVNVEYARGLLLKLEQDAQSIKVQSKKHETQSDLVRKRQMLQRLSERLEELNELADPESDDNSSEGEDLLGEDTPSETTDEQTSQAEMLPSSPTESISPARVLEPYSLPPISQAQTDTEPERPSTLRSRTDPRAELFSSSQTTGFSTSTSEAILTHNRTEQEALTTSLLSMASALKESSRAFATTLEDEKVILGRATEGLDKNELGLEAASRRMGYLRSMTEGRGMFGRMLMYVWISGLMLIAILIVFVGPKLRF